MQAPVYPTWCLSCGVACITRRRPTGGHRCGRSSSHNFLLLAPNPLSFGKQCRLFEAGFSIKSAGSTLPCSNNWSRSAAIINNRLVNSDFLPFGEFQRSGFVKLGQQIRSSSPYTFFSPHQYLQNSGVASGRINAAREKITVRIPFLGVSTRETR